jgi:hypothetical protein
VNRVNCEGDVALHDKIRRAWFESVDIALCNQVAHVAPQPVMEVRKTKAKAAASASSKGAVSAQFVADMPDDERRQRDCKCLALLQMHRRSSDADLRKAAEYLVNLYIPRVS